MTKLVFVVETGCVYEGGGVSAVFNQLEHAFKRAHRVMNQPNDNDTPIRWQKENKTWIQAKTRKFYWDNGYDYVSITIFDTDYGKAIGG